jgi:hypothetical protein
MRLTQSLFGQRNRRVELRGRHSSISKLIGPGQAFPSLILLVSLALCGTVVRAASPSLIGDEVRADLRLLTADGQTATENLFVGPFESDVTQISAASAIVEEGDDPEFFF